ncbi:amino acid adenylation domain-containing protein [Nonomuraea cavernae]|uniref:amino acid adenylation domain-containing protein n=1 Tax=Nonomuraea cavernae TaxID=2045107 RepID=UPI0033ED918C
MSAILPGPLTPEEAALWRYQQRHPLAATYNICVALEIEGPVDASVLRAAAGAVVRRHHRLRSAVRDEGGNLSWQDAVEPVWRVSPAAASTPRAWVRDDGAEAVREEARRAFFPGQALHRMLYWDLGPAGGVLQLTFHHCVCDGLSIRLAVREIIGAYRDLVEHPVTAAPGPAELPYRPLVTASEATRFWTPRLTLARELPALGPADPRATADTGVLLRRICDVDLRDTAEPRAKAAGASMFALTVSGLAATLARWSGDPRVAVGIPISHRTPAEDGQVSYRVRTLPARIEVAAGDTLGSLAGRVGQELRDAAMHADWGSGAELGDAMGGDSVVAVNLLQPAGMVTHHRPPPTEVAGLSWRPYLLHNGTAKFLLNVYVASRDGRLALTFECRAGGRPREELEWIADLTAAAVTEAFTLPEDSSAARAGGTATVVPGSPSLGDGGAAPGAQRQAPTGQSPSRRVGDGLLAEAARHPDVIAVVEDGPGGARAVTYRELAEASEQVAGRLAAAGIAPGQAVAVRLPRGAPLIAVAHGVLLAGGVLLPLDPELRPGRAAYLLGGSRAGILVEEDETGGPAACTVLGRPLRLAAARPETRLADAARRIPLARPDDAERAAYVMYTSGSTGRPKGVAVGHDGFANRLEWMRRAFPLGPGDVVLAKTPLSFDVCLWELFWPVTTGATVVTARHGRHVDAGYLCDVIERYGVTAVHFVPAMLGAFLDAASGRPLPGLRQVFSSGERLSRSLAERAGRQLEARVHNLYGPTEASIDVTWWTFDPDDGRSFVPIGRPIDGIQVRVHDDEGREVPAGVTGEIVIEGVGVALGYLGDGTEDHGRFRAGTATGEHAYRTGDLGRWRAGGVLEFLGRLDDQVKINGQRVELEEIDAVLGEHPEVTAAGVVYRAEAPGPRRLQAYVVLRGEVAAEELRAHAADRLPRSMIPTLFTAVDRLPYSTAGKLTRGELGTLSGRDLPWDASARQEGSGTPPHRWTVVHAAVGELLGLAEVPPDVDLFHLGVDSINAVRLVGRLRQAGLAVEVADLFETRTLRALTARLQPAPPDLQGPKATPPDLPHLPGQTGSPMGLAGATAPPGDERWRGHRVQRRFPLSRLQTGLVYHRDVSGDYLTYLTSYDLAGEVDSEVLSAALGVAAVRHEAVRTAFDLAADGGPAQVVVAQVTPRLVEHDLTGLTGPDQAGELSRWREEVRRSPFAWDSPPLFVFHLHRLAPDRAVLSIVEPFLDGWSVAVLGRDILDAYERALSARDGRPLPITARGTTDPIPSYASFVELERAATRDEAALAHWRGVVERTDTAWRLALAPGEPGEPATWQRHDHVFGEDELLAVREAAKTLGVSLRTLMWAVHMRTVALFTGSRVTGSAIMVNGRPELPGAEAMCGLFLNIMPVVTELGPSTTWRDLVEQVVTAERHSWRHRRTPYAALRGLAAGFEPSTVFNYTEFHLYRELIQDEGRALRLRGVTALDQTYMDLTVQCSLDATGRRLRVSVDHRAPAVTRADARRFLACLVHAVRTAARDVDALVEADRLPPAELARVVAAGRGPTRSRPAELSLPRVVERHAAARPDAVAVEDATESYTYAELAALSRHYARGIRRHTAEPHPVVGVLAPRSARSWAAVLAIWHAGGTYLPLSDRLPAERLARMTERGGVRLVFTDPRHGSATLPGSVRPLDLDDLPKEEGPPESPRPLAECAYILFTSGSTGSPRGARIGPAAMANHWWSKVDLLGLDEECVVGQSAPASFDVSLWQFAVPWLVGGRVVVLEDDLLLDPPGLFGRLDDRRVRVYETTPSHLATLLDAAEGQARPWPRPNGVLDVLMVTGEAVSAEVCRRWLRAGGPRIVNAYGPTECADDITHMVIDDPDITGGVPIGRPIPNIVCQVTDATGHLVPLGVEGELRVRGACLGLGYLNPADEAGRFLRADAAPHPVVAYRTGDRVRLTEQHTLLWLGRDDEQVKVRGHRIEPGDVETHLRSHPGVRDVAVVVVPTGGGRLRAVVVARPSGADRTTLLAHLSERVPAWMLPDEIVFVPALPLTPHGKLDRRPLAGPEYAPSAVPVPTAPSAEFADPRVFADLDAIVAGEWQKITGSAPEPGSDFYAEGGSSLDSVRLVSRLAARLGHPVTVTDLLRAPVYAAFVGRLRQTTGRAAPRDAPAALTGAVTPRTAGPLFGSPAGPTTGPTTGPTGPTTGPTAGPPPGATGVPIERLAGWPVAGLVAAVFSDPDELLTLVPSGRLDAAAVGYLTRGALERGGFSAGDVLGRLGERPVLRRILRTPLGTVGHYLLPILADDLFADPERLAGLVGRAARHARQHGAVRTALTGLVAAALDYGRALPPGLPEVTTGHDVTAAAVVLNVARALEETGTRLAEHRVAVIGLGSVGGAACRLLVSVLGHPAEIVLVEAPAAGQRLRDAYDALRQCGYRGPVRRAVSAPDGVTDQVRGASLLLGAASAAAIVDVDRLAEGTIVVDDSAPHMFDVADAARQADAGRLYVTEGGMLRWPEPLRELRWIPADPVLAGALAALRAYRPAPAVSMGCLVAALPELTGAERGVIGPPSPAQVGEAWRRLRDAGFRGVPMMLEDTLLPPWRR